MKVPLIDLSPQWRELQPDLLAALQQVFAHEQYILGDQVTALERAIAKQCTTKHAVGVANGTDALVLALHALNIGPGDEVITTPFTFFATAEAIVQVGATPVFVDVDPRTFNLDPTQIASRITARTKAILPVHIFGQMADMQAICHIADQHALHVIEDACQAIGASYAGKSVGSWGDLTAFSFFPTKNLGGYGDGGMIVLSDDLTASRLKRLRVHGSERKYEHVELGWNSRLDELQAAMLLVKLQRLHAWTEQRRDLAAKYDQAFATLPLTPPYAPSHSYHVYHLYTIVTDRRDELMAFLQANGVGCGVYYPIPLHLQRALQTFRYQPGDLPTAEYLSLHCLSLPLFPGMTSAQQEYVIHKVQEFFNINSQ